jgi:hypothetical protein
MYADTLDELKELMAEQPGASPSVFLRDDGFAAYCYDDMTVDELRSAFERDADPEECRRWGLSATGWKEHIAMALTAKIASESI